MTIPAEMLAFLRKNNLLQAEADWHAEPLMGGVASDIWHVSQGGQHLCIKQALAQLRVEQLWEVPVERNQYEVAWFKAAAQWVPQAVPKVLAHDQALGIFAMEYLPAAAYPVWKKQLARGLVETGVASRLGDTLGRIHAGSARDAWLARQFSTDELFYSIRIEPYLLATAQRNGNVAPELQRLASSLMGNKKTLVHGDVSPKNILVGPRGPVLIDAECAWYGDPAFDAAFLLNHLLLKCVWVPDHAAELMACFAAFWAAYRLQIDWEDAAHLEQRVSALLPGLFLARVDGKSPVEYVTSERNRETVRRFGQRFLLEPADKVATIRQSWLQAVQDGKD